MACDSKVFEMAACGDDLRLRVIRCFLPNRYCVLACYLGDHPVRHEPIANIQVINGDGNFSVVHIVPVLSFGPAQ